MIYLEQLIVAVVVVFVVDLSGFTVTWLGWLSKWTARYGYGPVRKLRPFSCSLCMTWWCCLLWALIRGQLSVYTVGASAVLAFFSITVKDVLIFMQEWAAWTLSKLSPKWKKED